MSRRWILLLLIAGALLVGGGVAWAYWTAPATPGSSGGGTAAQVNPASPPAPSRYADRAVRLGWPAVTLSNGMLAGGYVVRRYDAGTGALQTTLPGCAGTLAALTCTETTVPPGTWRWTVQGVVGANWTGAESAKSTPVTTGAAALTLAQTVFKGPFPVNTTGTLAGFGVNETVTWKLDAGTALTGFPGVVDVTGGAPISSLSIPSAAEGQHTVTATGGNGSVASTTITIDTVPPVVSSLQSPAAVNGWTVASPAQVSLAAVDATTGVASIRYTTDGSDPTNSGTAQTYTAPFSVPSAATVRYFATDTAGNASAVGSRVIKFDTVAPGNAVSLSSATGAALTGSTVYYRGVAAGSFTLTNTVTDAQSGPASSTSALGGTSTGFAHTGSTVTTPTGGPYVSNAFTWTAGTGSGPTVTLTGADVAGNTSASVLTLVNDSTPPSGGSVDATGLAGTGGRYSTSTAVGVAFTRGTDTGSGLAATGAELRRVSASLVNGGCGTYGSATVLATDPTSPYADTAPDQACHQYQYVVRDVVGNTTTYTSGDVRVDTTAPASPTFAYTAGPGTYASGQTLYYRAAAASGSFSVVASSSDAASGIAGYTYPAGGLGGTNWSGSNGSYAWSGTPGAPAARTVTAANNAGLTASAAMTLVEDSVAPTGGSLTYATGFRVRTPLTLTLNPGTDAGSGIGANTGTVQRRTGTVASPGGACSITTSTPWTVVATGQGGSWTDTTISASTCYEYQYSVADNLGNRTGWIGGPGQVLIPLYSSCAEAMAALPSDGYWRLDEAAGTVAADSSGKNNTGTYRGGYTLGQTGICGGTTIFNGSSGYVSTTNQVAFPGPGTFSEEVWFSTTSTAGGKLIGFGDGTTGESSNYDRHIFMGRDGKINFGVTTSLLNLGRFSITSPLAYNDGIWHHAAATLSSAGMRLYVDGTLVAQNTSVTTAQAYAGRWRLGGDSMAGWWPVLTSGSNYFGGALSNAAVWNTYALTPADVWNHFIAGWVATSALFAGQTVPSAAAEAPAASVQSVPRAPRTLAPSTPATPTPIPYAPSSPPSVTPRPTPSPSANTSPTPTGPPPPPPSDAPPPSNAPPPSDAPPPSVEPPPSAGPWLPSAEPSSPSAGSTLSECGPSCG